MVMAVVGGGVVAASVAGKLSVNVCRKKVEIRTNSQVLLFTRLLDVIYEFFTLPLPCRRQIIIYNAHDYTAAVVVVAVEGGASDGGCRRGGLEDFLFTSRVENG